MKNLSKIVMLAPVLVMLSGANVVVADGHVAAGAKAFKKCQTCHTLEKGKHKFGPSLYKIMGRKAGSETGFKYSNYYEQARVKGLVWDEKTIGQYISNPSGFLAVYLDMPEAKPKMMNKIAKGQERDNIVAFLKAQ